MQQNPWQVVDDLVEKEIFSPEGGDNLKYAISFATSLRLRAYHHYKVQDDRMDININYNPSDDPMLQLVFRLDKEELEQPEGAKLSQDTKGALFKYFFVTASLRNFLKSYCEKHTKLQPEDKKQFFSKEQFYDDCYQNRGDICYRLGRDDEGLKMYENHYDSGTKLSGDHLVNLALLGTKYNKASEFTKAERYLLIAIKIIEKIKPEDLTEGSAAIYGYLGDTYSSLGKKMKAFASYEKSRDIWEKIHKKDESIVDGLACAIARVGKWSADNNYYQDAEDSYTKAEGLFTKEYQSANRALFATFLANFGSVYFKLNKLDKALEYHIKALEMRKAIYQGKSHDDIDSSYTIFGQLYANISKKIKILKAVLAKLDSQDERVAKYSLELETLYSQKEAVETQLNHSQDHTSHVSDDTAENPYNPVVSLCDDVPLVGDSIV
jgi:tetratricopeptide (TPR) repeat protein